jgi:hypothetical protein
MGRLFVFFAPYLSAEFVPQARAALAAILSAQSNITAPKTAGGIRPSFADPRSAIGALGGA